MSPLVLCSCLNIEAVHSVSMGEIVSMAIYLLINANFERELFRIIFKAFAHYYVHLHKPSLEMRCYLVLLCR